MFLPANLLTLKSKADEKWLQGVDLESTDCDVEDIDACFDEAFETYQQVYETLEQATVKAVLATKEALTDDEQIEIINLYYVYKTLGTAYFDMGEYDTAYSLFKEAYSLHQRYRFSFEKYAKEVNEKELHAIDYNSALAKLYALEEEDPKYVDKETLVEIAGVFTKELQICREDKKTGYRQTRILDNLLKCKKLACGQEMEFANEAHKQQVLWTIRYVLTGEQIRDTLTSNTLLKSFDEFLQSVTPALSDEQRGRITSFTPPKSSVETKIAKMLDNLARFKQSAEYKKLKLHAFQEQAVTNFETHLKSGKNKGFYVAATGTGKTRIFISQILATNSKAIVLVPSIALAEQTRDKLQEQLDELGIKKKVGVFADKEKSTGDVIIMTYNSLKAQLKRPPRKRDFDLDQYPMVMFDEAHLALTEKADEIVKDLSQDKVVLGCTATDEYNTKRPKGALKSLKELFGASNCYFEYPIDKAIEEDSLSPIHICMVTTDLSLRWKRSRKEKKKGGQHEISEKEAAEQINKDKINTVVAEIYANCIHPNTGERIFGKQAVAFCAGVDHAKAVADKFNQIFEDNDYIKQKGLIPAAYISGEMSGEEQKRILDDYRAGKILMLCGSDILVTGIDNPNTCIEFNLRPTRSSVMALQRGGRTVRKSKDMPNKVALIFEFNWVVDGQVFLHDFLQGKHQLGKIPALTDETSKLQTLRREEVATLFENGARWELDWTGKVREHSVGVIRRQVEVKVPTQTFPVPFAQKTVPGKAPLMPVIPSRAPVTYEPLEHLTHVIDSFAGSSEGSSLLLDERPLDPLLFNETPGASLWSDFGFDSKVDDEFWKDVPDILNPNVLGL
ncbi:MAG: DEAD/DEAH box helicase family protein [Proteobacteria bacterium]|nr:DEAD/DEAH box helicase family protein [Pseudomonadota bacterium]